MNRRSAIVVGVGACVASAAALGAVSFAHESGPRRAPTPPWITDGNVVDLSLMPAWMPVSGPDGQPLLNKDGLMYATPTPAYATHGAPPVPDGMVAAPGIDPNQFELPPPPANADELPAAPDEEEDVYVGGGTVVLREEIAKAEAEGK